MYAPRIEHPSPEPGFVNWHSPYVTAHLNPPSGVSVLNLQSSMSVLTWWRRGESNPRLEHNVRGVYARVRPLFDLTAGRRAEFRSFARMVYNPIQGVRTKPCHRPAD